MNPNGVYQPPPISGSPQEAYYLNGVVNGTSGNGPIMTDFHGKKRSNRAQQVCRSSSPGGHP
jgi:hypothetical protein